MWLYFGYISAALHPFHLLPLLEMYEQRLSEEYVQDCFHSYLKSSLTQAKAERLLDTELLSSAEGDLMITGVFKIQVPNRT